LLSIVKRKIKKKSIFFEKSWIFPEKCGFWGEKNAFTTFFPSREKRVFEGGSPDAGKNGVASVLSRETMSSKHTRMFEVKRAQKERRRYTKDVLRRDELNPLYEF